MKTIVEINTTNYASTGNIALNIAKQARLSGFKVYTACKTAKESKKYKYEDQIYIGFWIDRIISQELAYITGLRGYFNVINTYLFINKLKKIKPDLIHLHVLHDTFINLRMLFNYIKKNNIPVVWTFHDCWAMTGQCPCFDMISCNKWRDGCHHCPQIHIEPKSLFLDTTKYMWNKKKKWFTSLNNMAIVTPSNWLSGIVKQSFFKNYPIKIINNGIDLNKFKYAESDFREKHNIKDKFILLGVANYWEKRKGLDVFIELSKRLSDKYQIVLIGTNDEIDSQLPSNIISIHRTYNQEELIKIYSACDLFVNPTREEVFGLVNVEALACGIPVVSFKTGGCPEIIDRSCGVIVEKNDIESLVNEIEKICSNKMFKKEECIYRSKKFDKNSMIKKYINLYKEILGELENEKR